MGYPSYPEPEDSKTVDEMQEKLLRKQQADEVAKLVLAELYRAVDKFPKFNSTHEGYAVIKEELDELWTEVMSNNRDLAVEEAVQVAAMAIRFITDLGRPFIDQSEDC